MEEEEQDVQLVEFPDNARLAVELLLSRTTTEDKPLPPQEGEVVLWRQRLRGGKSLVLRAVAFPLTEAEVADARAKQRDSAITVDRMPKQGEYYSELVLFRSSLAGNAIGIVPHGPQSLILGRTAGSPG